MAKGIKQAANGGGGFPPPSPAVKKAAEQLVKLSKELSEQPVVKKLLVNGVEYTPAIPKFNFNKKIYTAADLYDNQQLLETLVKMGSGVIKVINA